MDAIRVRNTFLTEWIDGTTIQTLGGGWDGVGADTAVTGFAWALYEILLKVLSILVPLKSPNLSKRNARRLKELLGKFFLWGDGFRDGRLESILYESDDLKETVVRQLIGIGNAIITKLAPACLLAALPPTREEIHQLSSELVVLLEKAKLLVTESDYETDTNSGPGTDVPSGTNESLKVILSLKTGIDCLMELLPSMETTLEYIQRINFDDKATSMVKFQVSGPARTYVLNVYDRFSKADSRLVERLGEANWQRHTALRAGLQQQKEAVEIPSTATVTGDPELPKSVFVPVSMFHDSGMGTSLPANSSCAATVASHSSFVSSLGDKNNGSLRVPPTPKEVSQGVPFACDICGHVLRRIKNRVDWRRHVFADLKPYICTFSGCKNELLTFPTRKLWEDHEFIQHRIDRSWSCSDCSQTFHDSEQWREHLQERHDALFSDTQFVIATKMAEKRRQQPIESQQCPLCLCIPGKSKRNFATHVGKHMEGIALAALPREATSDSESEAESLDGSLAGNPNDALSATSEVSADISVDPYSTYQNGQTILIGVLRRGKYWCQHLGVCQESFDNAEDLQLHFEAIHFSFTWMSPPHRFPCLSCSGLQDSATAICSQCGRTSWNETQIYGKFVRSSTANWSYFSNHDQYSQDSNRGLPTCQRCRKSRKYCDGQRPCLRCKDSGISADLCVNDDDWVSREGPYRSLKGTLKSSVAPKPLGRAAFDGTMVPSLILVPLDGDNEGGKVLCVPNLPSAITIGRSRDEQPQTQPAIDNGFFAARVLSRNHAEIWADGGKIWIRDVASSNGTFVNADRLSQENQVSEPVDLSAQDVLEFGVNGVAEDGETIIHHKVALRVEQAGFLGAKDIATAKAQLSVNKKVQPPPDDEGSVSSGDMSPSRPLSVSTPASPYSPRRPTLQEILANTAPPPWTCAAFMGYLSQNHCLETLEFTMDTRRYTSHYHKMVERDPDIPLSLWTQDCKFVKMLWTKLLDTYVAPNAPREVNLPSDVRNRLISLPHESVPPDPAELESAVKIIYELMDESVVIPFLNSVAPVRPSGLGLERHKRIQHDKRPDWQHHEETHWPQRRYMCLNCTASIAGIDQTEDGWPLCGFCGEFFECNYNRHIIVCRTAQQKGTTFNTKDELKTHLHVEHQRGLFGTEIEPFDFKVESGRPRSCAICGAGFEEWDTTVRHMANHFESGESVSSSYKSVFSPSSASGPMSIPNTRDAVPPPLPPPRYLADIADDRNKGPDIAWQWDSSDGRSGYDKSLLSVAPGSNPHSGSSATKETE